MQVNFFPPLKRTPGYVGAFHYVVVLLSICWPVDWQSQPLVTAGIERGALRAEGGDLIGWSLVETRIWHGGAADYPPAWIGVSTSLRAVQGAKKRGIVVAIDVVVRVEVEDA